MSIQVGCMICGESSPKTIDTGPAVEWSRAHRCSVPKLVELARERRTVSRIGKSTARETDRDLVIMGELAKQLSEAEARAGVVAEVLEWEYGCASSAHRGSVRDALTLRDQWEAREHGRHCPYPAIVRRPRAAAWEFWVPVKQEGAE